MFDFILYLSVRNTTKYFQVHYQKDWLSDNTFHES